MIPVLRKGADKLEDTEIEAAISVFRISKFLYSFRRNGIPVE